MAERQEGPVRIDCTECSFQRTVYPSDDELPADIVVRHGREMGHVLSISPVEPEDVDGPQSPLE